MTNITLSVPEETRKKMKSFEWLNWSAIAKEAFEKKMIQLEILKKFERDLEEKEIKEEVKLGNKIKEEMSKEYKRRGW